MHFIPSQMISNMNIVLKYQELGNPSSFLAIEVNVGSN